MAQQSASSSSSATTKTIHLRCVVCGDCNSSSGSHYGAQQVCDRCRGFFHYSFVNGAVNYQCKKIQGGCPINKESNRQQCQYCRLQKCLAIGMKREGVKTKVSVKKYCAVCGIKTIIRKHYGAYSCLTCYTFFRHSITSGKNYKCIGKKKCKIIKKTNKFQCQYCRLQKCLNVGMKREAVKIDACKSCLVCGDRTTSSRSTLCLNCKRFVQQTISKGKEYQCKGNKKCQVKMNNGKFPCQFCRMQKYFDVQMKQNGEKTSANDDDEEEDDSGDLGNADDANSLREQQQQQPQHSGLKSKIEKITILSSNSVGEDNVNDELFKTPSTSTCVRNDKGDENNDNAMVKPTTSSMSKRRRHFSADLDNDENVEFSSSSIHPVAPEAAVSAPKKKKNCLRCPHCPATYQNNGHYYQSHVKSHERPSNATVSAIPSSSSTAASTSSLPAAAASTITEPNLPQIKLKTEEVLDNCNKSPANKSAKELHESLKEFDKRIVEIIMFEVVDNVTQVSLDEIVGLAEVKKTLREIVICPMLRPDLFTGIRRPPKGLLLFGPSGSGKTMIGKCVAAQCQSTLFHITASTFNSPPWVAEDGEKMVRVLFAVARVHQPAVIFIDEIDSLLSQRSSIICSDQDEQDQEETRRKIKNEFLLQMDGIGASAADERLLVIGATNRPQEIDEATRRRFVKCLFVPLPDAMARKQMIQKNLLQTNHELSDEDWNEILDKTKGYSGSQIFSLCEDVSMGPIRAIPLDQIVCFKKNDLRPILKCDFVDSLQRETTRFDCLSRQME